MSEPWNGWMSVAAAFRNKRSAEMNLLPDDEAPERCTVYPRAEGDPEYGSRWMLRGHVIEVRSPIDGGRVMVAYVTTDGGLGARTTVWASSLRPLSEKKHEEWCHADMSIHVPSTGEKLHQVPCTCERRKGERRERVRRAVDRPFEDRGRRHRERRGGGA